MGVIEFLRDIGKHFSMTPLVQRDYIAKRLGEGGAGISYTEFSYTLLQGLDYLHLFDTEGAFTSASDRVEALNSGADDYIAKPFGFAELLARMRAVLRRTRSETERGVVSYGPLTVDVAARRVEMHGTSVALTGKEFDILACLASEPGRVVTREEIFDRAWDVNWYGPMKVLDVHVASLRRKLGDASLIETVYGRGFRLSKL